MNPSPADVARQEMRRWLHVSRWLGRPLTLANAVVWYRIILGSFGVTLVMLVNRSMFTF